MFETINGPNIVFDPIPGHLKLESKPKFIRRFILAAMALAFGVAYTQSPLYTANQHSYFLHGLKSSALPLLASDWMANTIDPFPLFSWLAHLTSVTLPPCAFHIYYALLLGIYVAGILGIACKTFHIDPSGSQILVCFLLLTGLHSAALADLSLGILGKNVVQLVDSGVAQQSLIGHEFIPSTFGVFLIVSIYAFLAGRPLLAVVLCAIAAAFHSSYILSAVVLMLIYAAMMIREERTNRKGLLTGLLGFALLLPVLLFIYVSFRPASAELFARSQSILVHVRIPHHADPGKWSMMQTAGAIAIILLGLYLAREKKIFPLLSAAFIAGLALTLIQTAISNDTLALLFPWRISTWLVPVSWGLIVAASTKAIAIKGSQLAVLPRKQMLFNLAILIPVVFLALYGGWKMYHRFQDYASRDDGESMMEFVSATAAPNQLYLVPTEMERFRLRTGVPIVADWKTHPYKDTEVVEWYERLLAANKFYGAERDSAGEALRDIQTRYGITHVVLSNRPGTTIFPGLHEVYHDNAFTVFEIAGR